MAHFIPNNICTNLLLSCSNRRRDNGWCFCGLKETDCAFRIERTVSEIIAAENFEQPTSSNIGTGKK